METHEIRYFLALVRELNFTRAANNCGITQPALTRAIKKLESELGGDLFLRRPGRIELTMLAREVLPQLEAIEASMAAVTQRAATVAEAQTSSLRLGVMCTVGPRHLVTLLSELNSSINDVDVTIIDAKAKEIVELIASDEIDIGLAAWPHYPDTVHVEQVMSERYAVAMLSTDAMASKNAFPLGMLAGQNYIDRLGCEFDYYYEARHGKWSTDLNIRFASEREDWVAALLLAGHGYAITPEHMEMPAGIVKLPLSEPEIRREICILTLRGKPLPPAAARFLRIARVYKWTP